MPRAISVLSPAERGNRPVIDTVILDYAQRSAQKIAVTGVKGGSFAIELGAPARLRTDDLLVLDDGGLVEVVAAPEPLIEARAADLPSLARLAWHLGDRHLRFIAWPRARSRARPPSTRSLTSDCDNPACRMDSRA
jgi:urease accessory protein